jgi:AhpD family alkylhydroperoxidase
MAHIDFGKGIPGIRGPMIFSSETAKPLNELAQVLLTGPRTLTPAEREMIATYVSSQNDCLFCQNCHGSIAAQHLGGSDADYELISQMKTEADVTCACPAVFTRNIKLTVTNHFVHESMIFVHSQVVYRTLAL